MTIENILILTVLMSMGTHNAIQAETIRGTVIPDFNLTASFGKWYGLVSGNNNSQLTCSTLDIGPLSENSFATNYTFYETTKEPYSLVFNCTFAKNSNIMICDKGAAGLMIAVIFDIDYDSYMAMYTTSTIENVASGNNGYVFILGRQKTLPDGILEKVKQSNFSLQGVKPGVELHIKRTDGC